MLDITSKMSMEGWWMVQTTVRPVLTVLRTVRMTMAAALASRPLVGSSCKPSIPHKQHAHGLPEAIPQKLRGLGTLICGFPLSCALGTSHIRTHPHTHWLD